MSTLKRGTIKSYSSSSHKASVQIAGSLAVWLDNIPVATDIPAAEVMAGRECAVLFFTDDNPDDAVVITVHGAVPSTGPIDLIQVYEGGVLVGETGPGVTLIEVYEGGVLVGSTP